MSSSEQSGRVSRLTARKVLLIAGLASATMAGGCSADLARFDFSNNSGLRSEPSRLQPPIPPEPMRRDSDFARDRDLARDRAPEGAATPYAYQPTPIAPAPVRQAGLPEPVVREPEPLSRSAGIQPPIRSPRPPRVSREDDGADAVVVVSGDTLYGISRRHKVSISELMSMNGLTNPTIYPGQRLTLPSGARPARPLSRTTREVADVPVTTQRPTSTAASLPAPSSDTAGWTGTHKVSPRDSLYAIARRYKVTVADLQAANGVTDPTRLRAGRVLRVPGNDAPIEQFAAPAPATTAEAEPGPFGVAESPKIINSDDPAGRQVAAAPPPAGVISDAPSATTPVLATPSRSNDSPPSASPGIDKFRWPSKGRIVSGFGPRPDGTHNDGINILVPLGTPVHAAETGTVAYAGSELKGYGNLILVRHSGNWVSAYAHNDQLLVKRGDKVKRGQAIAKAGKTGAVDQPQIHFELRQGSKPVDPMPYLEK